jgi:hypothetical protein
LQLESLARGQRLDAQLYQRPAVLEAALVNRVALVQQRLVDLDACAAFAVGVLQHHLAGKELGHAGVVVLDDELLQLQLEGQALPDRAAGQVQPRNVSGLALGHEEVGAKARCAGVQNMLLAHLTPAFEELLALHRHRRAHQQVAVQQAAQADQHDGAVRRQVAELVGLALARGEQQAVVALLILEAPAVRFQALAQQRLGPLRRLRPGAFRVMRVQAQRLLARLELGVLPVAQDLGRLARDAQAGAEHQEREDEQEPRRAVDREQVQAAEQLGPKGAEFVHVVGQRLALLQHGANDGGDADHAEQRDGEAHRGQHFGQLAPEDSHGFGLSRYEKSRCTHRLVQRQALISASRRCSR